MKKFIILLITVAAALSGCESNTSSTETAGSVLPADIIGRVNLLDTSGNAIPNKSGVTVTIERTSFSATSDSNGVFRLRSIPPGTYTFRYEKEGFATIKDFTIQHIGNGTLYLEGYAFNAYDMNLYQLPKRKVELTLNPFAQKLIYRDTSWIDTLGNVVRSYVLDSTLVAQFSIPYGGYSASNTYPLLYFARNKQIDPENPSSFTYLVYLPYSSSWGGTYATTVFKDSLLKYGFPSGSQVFVQTARPIVGYFDVETQTMVNTYGYFSEVRSFIVP